MKFSTRIAVCSFLAASLLGIPAAAQESHGGAPAKLYNTAKQKLLDGKQINGHTISRADSEAYCAAAPHYDFTWFEMQHATLSYADVEKMIAACPRVGAVPFIRVPDATESNIQKATDLGVLGIIVPTRSIGEGTAASFGFKWCATSSRTGVRSRGGQARRICGVSPFVQKATDLGVLGIIVPTVDTPEKAQAAAKWARYPPDGRRSRGGGQARRIWGVDGIDYRGTFNDNMLVVLMIETPVGVSYAADIAGVAGVDVVIIGNSDLTNFSGYPAEHPRYQQMLVDARDAVLKAGKFFGTASAQYRSGHPLSKDVRFTQGGPPNDSWTPPPRRR